MHLDDESLNELCDRFEVEWPSNDIVAEFNRRVAMPDDDVEVVGIANDLYPTMAKFGSTYPGANYAELRELEKTTKAFFVYVHLVAAAVAREESLVEICMWQLEAARRLASEATYDISYWQDGERGGLEVWSTGNRLAVNTEEIELASPLAPVERRINELVDRAALRALDHASHDDVAKVVRMYHDELPRAAAKLEGIDAARGVTVAIRFRDADGHPKFRAWLDAQASTYSAVLSVDEYLSGVWLRRLPLRGRGPYFDRADWLLENWEDSDLAAEVPHAGHGRRYGSQEKPGGDSGQRATAREALELARDPEGDGLEVLARLSWTAYVGPVIGWLVLLVFVVPVWLLFGATIAAGVFALAWLGLGSYRFLLLRSVVLFMDGDGVWVQRGILPWDRGTYGVKWRDVDEAVFVPGFIDWATSSYTVVVRHRFTKDAEIVLPHVPGGAGVVERINERHAECVGSVDRRPSVARPAL